MKLTLVGDSDGLSVGEVGDKLGLDVGDDCKQGVRFKSCREKY